MVRQIHTHNHRHTHHARPTGHTHQGYTHPPVLDSSHAPTDHSHCPPTVHYAHGTGTNQHLHDSTVPYHEHTPNEPLKGMWFNKDFDHTGLGGTPMFSLEFSGKWDEATKTGALAITRGSTTPILTGARHLGAVCPWTGVGYYVARDPKPQVKTFGNSSIQEFSYRALPRDATQAFSRCLIPTLNSAGCANDIYEVKRKINPVINPGSERNPRPTNVAPWYFMTVSTDGNSILLYPNPQYANGETDWSPAQWQRGLHPKGGPQLPSQIYELPSPISFQSSKIAGPFASTSTVVSNPNTCTPDTHTGQCGPFAPGTSQDVVDAWTKLIAASTFRLRCNPSGMTTQSFAAMAGLSELKEPISTIVSKPLAIRFSSYENSPLGGLKRYEAPRPTIEIVPDLRLSAEDRPILVLSASPEDVSAGPEAPSQPQANYVLDKLPGEWPPVVSRPFSFVYENGLGIIGTPFSEYYSARQYSQWSSGVAYSLYITWDSQAKSITQIQVTSADYGTITYYADEPATHIYVDRTEIPTFLWEAKQSHPTSDGPPTPAIVGRGYVTWDVVEVPLPTVSDDPQVLGRWNLVQKQVGAYYPPGATVPETGWKVQSREAIVGTFEMSESEPSMENTSTYTPAPYIDLTTDKFYAMDPASMNYFVDENNTAISLAKGELYPYTAEDQLLHETQTASSIGTFTFGTPHPQIENSITLMKSPDLTLTWGGTGQTGFGKIAFLLQAPTYPDPA